LKTATMDARKPLPWIDRVETYRGRFAPEAVIPFRELDRVEGYSRTFGQRSGSNTGTTRRRRFDRLTRPATIRIGAS